MRPLHIGSEIGRRIGHYEKCDKQPCKARIGRRRPCFIGSLHARQREVGATIGAPEPANGFIVVRIGRPSPDSSNYTGDVDREGAIRRSLDSRDQIRWLPCPDPSQERCGQRRSTDAAMTEQTACGIRSSFRGSDPATLRASTGPPCATPVITSQTLPKETGLPEWQTAIEALMLVIEQSSPTMFARIGVCAR